MPFMLGVRTRIHRVRSLLVFQVKQMFLDRDSYDFYSIVPSLNQAGVSNRTTSCFQRAPDQGFPYKFKMGLLRMHYDRFLQRDQMVQFRVSMSVSIQVQSCVHIDSRIRCSCPDSVKRLLLLGLYQASCCNRQTQNLRVLINKCLFLAHTKSNVNITGYSWTQTTSILWLCSSLSPWGSHYSVGR